MVPFLRVFDCLDLGIYSLHRMMYFFYQSFILKRFRRTCSSAVFVLVCDLAVLVLDVLAVSVLVCSLVVLVFDASGVPVLVCGLVILVLDFLGVPVLICVVVVDFFDPSSDFGVLIAVVSGASVLASFFSHVGHVAKKIC